LKVLGWLAVTIAVLSVLVGLSPVFIALVDEEFVQAGWAFLFATLPIGALGLFVAGVLAVIGSAVGLARGAKIPGLLGVIGMVVFVASVLVGISVLLPDPEPSEALTASVLILGVLGYASGLIGAMWAGFTTQAKSQSIPGTNHE
jgi:hypothetical protein